MFEPKPYRYSEPFKGDAADALAVARTALLSLGFEILVDSGRELHARGPGMHSNRQPELLGASLIKFSVSTSEISVVATLGGVATMKAFIYLFPPGLVLSLMAINSLFGMPVSWAYALAVAPWLLIAPLMGRGLERKTQRAVARLVRGMAQARRR